jgi:hypothetical protein
METQKLECEKNKQKTNKNKFGMPVELQGVNKAVMISLVLLFFSPLNMRAFTLAPEDSAQNGSPLFSFIFLFFTR